MKNFLTATASTLTITFSLIACAADPLPNIVIQDTQVYPESVTSTADGRVFVGSVAGNVYRAEPGADKAFPFIKHSEDNGILTILGVLADEGSNTLWLCSVPNLFGAERSQGQTSLMAFDLESGAQKGVYPFLQPGGCNDVTIGADGTAYATDTPNGRIYSLVPGAEALTLFAEDDRLNGIDGIAFSEEGILYVNNVQTSKIFRVETDAQGKFSKLTEIEVTPKLNGPDSMRLLSGNRFIQAESGYSRLSIITIDGDRATMKVLKNDLTSSPGATAVGNTAYVLESNIRYLVDPHLRGQDPGDFVIYAVPMD